MYTIGPEPGTLLHRDALLQELCKGLKVTGASEVQAAWTRDVRLFLQAVECLRKAQEAVQAAKAAAAHRAVPGQQQPEGDSGPGGSGGPGGSAGGSGGPGGRSSPAPTHFKVRY